MLARPDRDMRAAKRRKRASGGAEARGHLVCPPAEPVPFEPTPCEDRSMPTHVGTMIAITKCDFHAKESTQRARTRISLPIPCRCRFCARDSAECSTKFYTRY